jgi:hypothetical protein
MKLRFGPARGHIQGHGLLIGLLFALAVLALGFLGCLFGGWLLMLLFGVLHSHWLSVPAFGIWISTFIVFVVTTLFGVRSS